MHIEMTAVALASAIYANPTARFDIDALADQVYNTVDILAFTDEQKAELYARLADNLSHDTKFGQARSYIEDALRKVVTHA